MICFAVKVYRGAPHGSAGRHDMFIGCIWRAADL